jgi:hypothetical protein
MPGNPHETITTAERSYPVRVRIGVPPGGLCQRYSQMTGWLDGNCGSDGWAMTPSGVRGVLNDARFDLFRGCHPRQRLRGSVVRRVCSKCAMMSRRRGLGRSCIGRPSREGRRTWGGGDGDCAIWCQAPARALGRATF